MRKIVARAAAAVVVVTWMICAPSDAAAKYATYVIDAQSGEVLQATNERTRNYPASLTKLMTLYILFEDLRDGKLTLKSKFKMVKRAARQPPSKLGLKPGQEITVDATIKALVVKSANDIASMVAHAVSGNERKFALRMTATARKLGMSRTTFRNASGLPHRSQLSTAQDMAILARALLRDFPQYYHYFKQRRFTYGGKTYKSHNGLLKSYRGGDGFKTGYIRASGYNLVFSAERAGRRLIGVVFGGKSAKSRDRRMARLLNRGFAKVLGPRLAKAETPAKKPSPPPHVVSQGERQLILPKNRRWGIQVGAFNRRNEAQKTAVSAYEKLPDLLGEGKVMVVPLHKRKKILYRARIVGLAQREAYAACRSLEKRRFDCMELKLPVGVQMAQATR